MSFDQLPKEIIRIIIHNTLELDIRTMPSLSATCKLMANYTRLMWPEIMRQQLIITHGVHGHNYKNIIKLEQFCELISPESMYNGPCYLSIEHPSVVVSLYSGYEFEQDGYCDTLEIYVNNYKIIWSNYSELSDNDPIMLYERRTRGGLYILVDDSDLDGIVHKHDTIHRMLDVLTTVLPELKYLSDRLL